MIRLFLVILLSYLVGAIPWSYIAGRLLGGVDLRTVGSGNLGATNVYRALGACAAVAVLALDILKGFVAPLGFARLAGAGPVPPADLAALAGLAAILGHVFPVYLGFRGGKGIATSAGVFAALEPRAFGVAAALFGLGFAASRGIVSVGSLVGSLALPLAVYFFGVRTGDLHLSHLAVAAGLTALVWIKHVPNLRRLVGRSEKSLFDPAARATTVVKR